jgi:hypothetical protein
MLEVGCLPNVLVCTMPNLDLCCWTRVQTVRALEFYIAPDLLDLPAGTTTAQANDPVFAVFGLDLSAVYAIIQNNALKDLTDAVKNQVAANQQAGAAPSAVEGAITDVAGSLDRLGVTADALRDLADRGPIVKLYQNLKTYVCCDYSEASDALWVSWTVSGVMAFLLAMMCSGRVIWAARRGQVKKT